MFFIGLFHYFQVIRSQPDGQTLFSRKGERSRPPRQADFLRDVFTKKLTELAPLIPHLCTPVHGSGIKTLSLCGS